MIETFPGTPSMAFKFGLASWNYGIRVCLETAGWGCELWQQFGLDQFWEERLPEGRERIGWDKVLQLLVINRLIEPGSEFRLHRHWIVSSAMDEPLNTDFIVAKKDRLYRCLDRLLEPKRDLFLFLRQKWADLFAADFEVLLGKNCADR